MTLDELCPEEVGRRALRLLPATLDPPRAFNAYDLEVGFDPTLGVEAERVGLVLPLELTITAPTRSGFVRHVYRRVVPGLITFVPKEGGLHLVRLSELGHNRYWGAYVVDVAGERLAARVA